MSPDSSLHRPTTVTFDCWATLIVEASPASGHTQRAAAFAKRLGVAHARAAEALERAWREHQIAWHRREVFGAPDMVRAALDGLGVQLSPSHEAALVESLEDLALERRVMALPGSRAALEQLAERGVRRALICDTGFSPGRVVRELLDRVGLLSLLEVTIFSNEVGVPKPHPRMFAAALEGLGVESAGAVHVGDLRRSDIAGGRAAAMGTVRMAQHYDDAGEGGGARAMAIGCLAAGCSPPCARPEAHAVVHDYRQLVPLLGY